MVRRHPVTAGDFVYTYRKLVNPKEGACSSISGCVQNAKKIRSGELSTEELGLKRLMIKHWKSRLKILLHILPKLLTGSRFLPQSEKVAKEKAKDTVLQQIQS